MQIKICDGGRKAKYTFDDVTELQEVMDAILTCLCVTDYSIFTLENAFIEFAENIKSRRAGEKALHEYNSV